MIAAHSTIGLRLHRAVQRTRKRPCLCHPNRRQRIWTPTHLPDGRCEKCRGKVGSPTVTLGELTYTRGGRRVA